MKNRDEVLRTLDALGIRYTLIEHDAFFTIEDCMRIQGIEWTTTEIPRNALLAPASAMRSRAFTTDPGAYLEANPDLRFTLMLLRHDIPFRTQMVSRALGISRLSFAPPEALPPLLGLTAGSVSPLGLPFDAGERVTLVMDEGLRGYEKLAFHPCDNTATVVLRQAEFLDVYLPAIGRKPQWVDAAD